MDLVVSCSKREGMPLNIIEAMLCQKPVVASHNRGHDELVHPHENGILVPFDDVEALSAGVLRFYQNTDISRTAGLFGYEIAHDYTTRETKEALYRFLKE